MPTAYDYIRLGHPLSCILEWTVGKLHGLDAKNVISFSSSTTPILAVLRKNLFEKKNTQIFYHGKLPAFFDAYLIKSVYGYSFDLKQIESLTDIITVAGKSNILLTQTDKICHFETSMQTGKSVDFFINIQPDL